MKERYSVKFFEGGPGKNGTFAVLDFGDMIVCDCQTFGDPEMDAQAEFNANRIAQLLNAAEQLEAMVGEK